MAWAGAHTWKVNELFSDATGTIQFIEFREGGGGAGEIGFPGHNITSTTRVFTVPGAALAAPTSFKSVLIATPACAALPGMPTPDYVLPAGLVPFITLAGDSISYVPFNTLTFGAGALPTDGVHSLNANLTTGCNSPTNYAGQSGSVNVSCPLKGDVDGSGARDGHDVAAFARVAAGTPIAGDNAMCAEYCTGTLAGNITAFVNDLLL